MQSPGTAAGTFGPAQQRWRRVATRYEKREANYMAMVTTAAIVLLWLE
jgi:transposase